MIEKEVNYSSLSEYLDLMGVDEPASFLKSSDDDLLPSTRDYIVSFSGSEKTFCVGLVDIVNSTKISAKMSYQDASRYYEIFLNSMSRIISRFQGQVIKNIGDCLLYYFPKSEQDDNTDVINCIECGLAMVDEWDSISDIVKKEHLPSLDYRISSDYGSVVFMKINNTISNDMIGSTLNICSKINRYAKKNGFVIGGDLSQVMDEFSQYKSRIVKDYSLGLKYAYPVYEVSRKK